MNLQYEACQEALQLLESTPDAQGRKLEVFKVQLPPNLFLSQDEASVLVVSNSDLQNLSERLELLWQRATDTSCWCD